MPSVVSLGEYGIFWIGSLIALGIGLVIGIVQILKK